MTSSRCERSSPITCIVPPQHGQAVSSGSMTTSTRGRCSGSGPRPARRFSERASRSAGSAFSCSASPAAIACSRHPLQLAKQVAQPIVLAGELIALFDQSALLGALGVALRPCRQHQGAQRSKVVGKGVGPRHGRNYLMSPALCDPQPQGEST
jgi:hypothetical protein